MSIQKPETTEDALKILHYLEPGHSSPSILPHSSVYVLVGHEDPTEEAFYRGEVLTVSEEKATVQLLEGPKHVQEFSLLDVFPMDLEAEKGLEDLSKVPQLHEASLLINLQSRFISHEAFTKLAETLIFVNPYDELVSAEEHLAETAEKVLRDLETSKQNQTIIISGESGSGKTEIFKRLLPFFVHPNDEHIRNCLTILHAFGNAKTDKNDNASRFGLAFKLHYINSLFTNATFETFMLEKNRVVNRLPSERNFHVFYYFLNGAPEYVRKRLELKELQTYRYLAGSETIEGWDDVQGFVELRDALVNLGFSEREQAAVWKLLTIVLSLGNIEFDDSVHSDTVACKVTEDTQQYLVNAARLLGIPPEELLEPMVTEFRVIGNSAIALTLPKTACEDYRDGFAKSLYSRLFHWIVQKCNKNANSFSDYVVNILDFCGFESYQINEFEQLCINYAEEKLHQVYLAHVLKKPSSELEKEGLGEFSSRVLFSDNLDVLEILEGYPLGVLNLVDEACSFKGDDTRLLESLNSHHSENELFQMGKDGSFLMSHTHRDVQYKVEGFRAKNMEEVRRELSECAVQGDTTIASIAVAQTHSSRFVGAQLRKTLASLLTEIDEESQCHFVLCIKPNEIKKQWYFQAKGVLVQVQYYALFDSIAMRRQGFPNSYTYQECYQKFYCLHPSKPMSPEFSGDWQGLVEDIIDDCLPGIDESFILFGKSRIFLKDGAQALLQTLKEATLELKESSASKITRFLIAKNSHQFFLKQRAAATAISKNYRMFYTHRYYNFLKGNTMKIQRWYRAVLERDRIAMRELGLGLFKIYLKYKFEEKLHFLKLYAAITAQRLWRGRRGRKRAKVHKFIKRFVYTRLIRPAWEEVLFSMRLRAALQVQKVVRGHLCRKHEAWRIDDFRTRTKARKLYRAATNIQKIMKGGMVRRRLARLHRAARYIQGFFRARWTYQLFKKVHVEIRRIQRAVRAYLVRSKVVNARLDAFVRQETAHMANLRLLERSQLFAPLQVEAQVLAESNAPVISPGTTQLSSAGTRTVALQSEKMAFFCRVLDLDMISDISVVYDPLWASQLERLGRELNDEALLKLGVGSAHSLGLSHRGRLFSWGWDDCGQCTHSSQGPRQIEALKETRVVGLSCGDDHSLLLTAQGTVLAFGDNSKGQLGQGTYSDLRGVQQVKLPPARQAIAVGAQNMAVTLNGEAFMWPYETVHREKRSLPVQVLQGVQVAEVSLGFNFALILAAAGQLFSMGSNQEGQLGHGDTLSRGEPTAIASLRKEKVAAVACGLKHVVCRTSLGKVYTWGWGGHGQLGHNSQQSELVPRQVYFKDSRFKFIQISAGWRHSVFMLENRNLLWCGTNGTLETVTKPTSVDLKSIMPELFDGNGDFCVVKVECAWSRGLSLTNIIVTDISHLQVNKVKLHNTLNALAAKWTASTIDPPLIDSIAKFYPSNTLRKSSPKKQTRQRRDVTPEPKFDTANAKDKVVAILSKPEASWTDREKLFMKQIAQFKPL